jgi:hypothetical protein
MVPGYNKQLAPTILLTSDQHRATVRIWEQFKVFAMDQGLLPSRIGPRGVQQVDWRAVPDETKLALSDALMEGVGVAKEARESYHAQFGIYLANQQALRSFQKFDVEMNEWQQQQQQVYATPGKGE